jgi:hypothetical protein
MTICHVPVQIDAAAEEAQGVRRLKPSCRRVVVTSAEVDESTLGINLFPGVGEGELHSTLRTRCAEGIVGLCPDDGSPRYGSTSARLVERGNAYGG